MTKRFLPRVRAFYIGLLAALLIGFTAVPAGAEEFVYKYQNGAQYRILSTVFEDVFVNGQLSHSAEIINRIAVETTDVVEGSGKLRASFQTAERGVFAPDGAAPGAAFSGDAAAFAGTRAFEWSKQYESEYTRDRLGYLTIDDSFYMPVVRNVPVFPGVDLNAGDTWSADGEEVHDFRESFGIAEPYRIPFTADYTFLGTREWKGRQVPAFSVSYRIFYNAPAVQGRVWPNRIQGASDQLVYWDSELGMTFAYEEDFRIIISLSDGRTVEFRGRAFAEIIEAPAMDKEAVAEEVGGEIERLDIKGATVRVTESGVIISLENIQFMPDSSVLMQEEKLKLDKLLEIIGRYPERDLLVGGHTALAGTAEMRAVLSLERAQAVADYLIEQNARTPDRIVVQGYGAEQPLADNNTAEGRERNRRVEIIILEN